MVRPQDAVSGMPRALVISGSMGAGHDGAGRELVRRLRERGVEVVLRDFLDALPRPYRTPLRDGYAFTVRHVPAVYGRLARAEEHDSVVRRGTLRMCRTAGRRVARWAAGSDVAVTTFPLASQTLGMLRQDGVPAPRVVCCLTDPAPNRLWLHPGVDVYLTVCQVTVNEAAERYGVAMAVGGPLVASAFRSPVPEVERRALRTELGVPPGRRMVLLVAGALGVGDLPASAAAVRAAPGCVAVALCGRNERLRRKVAALRGVVALGWRDDMPRLMAAADVLVHNAGGLSLTEALVAGLPAVSYRALSGHGRSNAATLARAGLAPWPRTPRELADALERQASRGRVFLPPVPAGQETADVVATLARQGRRT
ncbi:hypothetical protein AF335_07420 [Streptomyces eurocidicus]|uniref:UDP-N-acetylglucosamine:LPS N-acetylglucosamine transferase n=1 Tax=Streptomyces eurocidicus TaxID=66423 RepID=A0A2N8P069_STREU|nr:glycosyltransferase [Streptomyces eurocidicus]MBB5118965.1 UDP-N-acetylglucosamine:LPS N-acetylglucosamine transferase [Streptomyces eurocidicus]MBF6051228.1 glycosyltransferase [Streptomyces eurocidicus]PNE34417.1 hypothetical protein AF335_07420 [Streptomyces eurocidicus]